MLERPSYHEAKANLALAYKNIGKIGKSLDIYETSRDRGLQVLGFFAITNVTSGISEMVGTTTSIGGRYLQAIK